jgi:hypothetical protein
MPSRHVFKSRVCTALRKYTDSPRQYHNACGLLLMHPPEGVWHAPILTHRPSGG